MGAEIIPTEMMSNIALVRMPPIQLGSNTSYAISEGGILWYIGGTPFGFLPEFHRFSEIAAGHPIRVMDNIVDVRLGLSHTLALTSEGQVWAWGQNNGGGIQYPATPGVNTNIPPTLIMENVEWIAVSQGNDSASFAMTQDGHLYAWGGIFGDRIRVEGLGDFTDLYFSDRGLAAVSGSGGSIFVRVGCDPAEATDDSVIFTPTIIDWDDRNLIKHIVTYNNQFKLFDNGILQGVGANAGGTNQSNGRLIDPSSTENNINQPQTIIENIVYFTASNWVAIAIDNDGQIWAWGRNHSGQMGQGYASSHESFTPVNIER